MIIVTLSLYDDNIYLHYYLLHIFALHINMVEFIIKVKENVYAFYCFSYGIVDENNANDFLSIEVNEIFLSYRERQLFLHLHNNRNVYSTGWTGTEWSLAITEVTNITSSQFPRWAGIPSLSWSVPNPGVYWSYMFSLSFFRVCVMHMLKEHCIL